MSISSLLLIFFFIQEAFHDFFFLCTEIECVLSWIPALCYYHYPLSSVKNMSSLVINFVLVEWYFLQWILVCIVSFNVTKNVSEWPKVVNWSYIWLSFGPNRDYFILFMLRIGQIAPSIELKTLISLEAFIICSVRKFSIW